jgi:hypothetical protein
MRADWRTNRRVSIPPMRHAANQRLTKTEL